MYPRARDLVLLSAAVLLAGCGSTAPIRYYQLMPISTPVEAKRSDSAINTRIGVGPIIWPEYLDRPQRIVRQGDTGMALADDERWAEPLEVNFSRVLRENIARITGSDEVIAYPWPATQKPSLQLAIEVLRFDSNVSGKATLEARWQVLGASGETLQARRRSLFEVAANGAGGDGAVAAQNEALRALSQEISDVLRKSAVR